MSAFELPAAMALFIVSGSPLHFSTLDGLMGTFVYSWVDVSWLRCFDVSTCIRADLYLLNAVSSGRLGTRMKDLGNHV